MITILSRKKLAFGELILQLTEIDGSLKLLLDLRQLNKAIKRSKYLLPNIDELHDKMGRCHYFSSLDLQSTYWQVENEEKDREKSALTTDF